MTDAPERQTFAYHRAIAPMMWAFVALGFAELGILHLLVSLWNPTAAFILSALTLAAIVWMVLWIRSFRRLPVVIERGQLTFRVGSLFRVETPLTNVAGLRANWDSAALKAPGLINMALIAYPNVIVDFATPVPRGRKAVGAVAHRLDDPGAFTRALSAISHPDA